MKLMFKLFAFLYMFAPLLIVSYLAYHNQNWVLLFGILFCYLGSFLAARKSKIIYLVTVFCIIFWIKSGFDFSQYVTFFFFCLLWGNLIYLIAENYDQESKRGTIENDEELVKHTSANQEELKNNLAQYLKEHPETIMDYELIDKIAKGKL